eukprot:CAMPEP_0119315522 /NCGR_PEP_ID=MMETSP1333-20130426/36207_1 /TAXON_ID=418940 /ORGANISM="Scyphosphaera apsteinii, Strain RCC1455" /LENGTH=303 /DNA_ID=CAMNT_0007320915 /DNA_START=148 /DNA_END=1059 /DNA_ORIENTATION=+
MCPGYPGFDFESAGKLELSFEASIRGFYYAESSTADMQGISARVFSQLQKEAAPLSDSPLTSAVARRYVLDHVDLPSAMLALVVDKIGGADADVMCEQLQPIAKLPSVERGLVSDLVKAVLVDPAADSFLQPMMFFKGYHALAAHRFAHELWKIGKSVSASGELTAESYAALLIQSRCSELFGVDIHPAATIGPGVMLDHATGIVIGSTAIIGSDIYCLHQVTLGATGKPTFGAKRHPTVGNRCVLGAGSTVLGDITVGDDATIGAAAIITRDVPIGATVVGINKVVEKQGLVECEYTWMYDI